MSVCKDIKYRYESCDLELVIIKVDTCTYQSFCPRLKIITSMKARIRKVCINRGIKKQVGDY